ncbi:hypothetical protein [Agarilytica rhodophyticola]|uniref:hypothetical protein n=1 Tax=Agarilytica rhodophyticola TaxID=1737490 RepID=UPI000B341CB3|nr:hypothetical protein [Agarilytica rhodophyticola]
MRARYKTSNYRKAIGVKRGAESVTNSQRGISLGELRMMRNVMRKTDGMGGPWFYQYAIKGGLL